MASALRAPRCSKFAPRSSLTGLAFASLPHPWRLRPGFPASGLRASLACSLHAQDQAVACSTIFPDFITLSATVARGRVPSRRARPCPRLRLRAAPTCRLFPWRPCVCGLLTVAGDELRKDGGNEANRVLRADRTSTAQKRWARILESGVRW